MSNHPVALTNFLNALLMLAFLIASQAGADLSAEIVAGTELVLNTGIAFFAKTQGPVSEGDV